jgi:hypothetical protein
MELIARFQGGIPVSRDKEGPVERPRAFLHGKVPEVREDGKALL